MEQAGKLWGTDMWCGVMSGNMWKVIVVNDYNYDNDDSGGGGGDYYDDDDDVHKDGLAHWPLIGKWIWLWCS